MYYNTNEWSRVLTQSPQWVTRRVIKTRSCLPVQVWVQVSEDGLQNSWLVRSFNTVYITKRVLWEYSRSSTHVYPAWAQEKVLPAMASWSCQTLFWLLLFRFSDPFSGFASDEFCVRMWFIKLQKQVLVWVFQQLKKINRYSLKRCGLSVKILVLFLPVQHFPNVFPSAQPEWNGLSEPGPSTTPGADWCADRAAGVHSWTFNNTNITGWLCKTSAEAAVTLR